MNRLLALAGAATLTLVVVGSAGAEHTNGEMQTSVDLGLGLRLGKDGFSVDGRMNGPGGPWGLRLDGRMRPESFSVDGRIHDAQRNYDFRLDGSLTTSPRP